jgi:hypothetical protein
MFTIKISIDGDYSTPLLVYSVPNKGDTVIYNDVKYEVDEVIHLFQSTEHIIDVKLK